MKKLLLLFFGSMLFWGCPINDFNPQIEDVGMVDGMKPVYASVADWQDIKLTDPIPITKLGKIYYKDGFMFVSEKYKGVHIINNTDPENPVKIKFLQIVGNKDIAIKGNRLYADNYTDLVTLDISSLESISVVNRLKDVYPAAKQAYPASYEGYFECVDNSNGIVIDWEEAVLENPDCWR